MSDLITVAHKAYYESETRATWSDRLNVSPVHDAAIRAVVEAVAAQVRAHIAADIASMEASGEDRYALGFRAAVKYAAFLARGDS